MYTAEQQARIDDAQQKLNTARTEWQGWAGSWNQHFVGLPCYADIKYGPEAGATWFTPNDSSCTRKGDCDGDDKQHCKTEIEFVREKVIPPLRKAYSDLNLAQLNYDKVIAEIAEEVKNDPDLIKDLLSIQSNAAADAVVRKQKYIFYGIVVVVIAASVFIYFKWFRK